MYFNFRSPYSWLALHDLTTRHSDLSDVIEWRPAWEPDPASEDLLKAVGGRVLYTPMSREKHLYVLGDVRRLANERSLRVSWPNDSSPRWEVSNLAYLVAVDCGLGKDFAVAISRARWEQGRDIAQPTVVAEIGVALGLDPVRLAKAADDPAMVVAGTPKLMDMYRDRVFGVPYFVHRYERFWGIDRLEAFITSIRSVETIAPQPGSIADTVTMAMSDDGHAGGCG